jgi:hypothetical protein
MYLFEIRILARIIHETRMLRARLALITVEAIKPRIYSMIAVINPTKYAKHLRD